MFKLPKTTNYGQYSIEVGCRAAESVEIGKELAGKSYMLA